MGTIFTENSILSRYIPNSPPTMFLGANSGHWTSKYCLRLVLDVRHPDGVLLESPLPLLPLRYGRRGTAPVFCLPGAGASVTSYVDLIENIDASLSIFGFQPRGLDGDVAPHTSVEGAADNYVRALTSFNPIGPLHLIGHSFGGWVALEMANRLTRMGRPALSLTVIDSEVPDGSLKEYDDTEATMHWAENFELLLGHGLRVCREDLQHRSPEEQCELLHRELVCEGLMSRRSKPMELRGPLRTFFSALRTQYQPKMVYQGFVSLILVDDPRLDFAKNALAKERLLKGWSNLVPHLKTTYAPGNHLTVLRPPHVKALADIIQTNIGGLVRTRG